VLCVQRDQPSIVYFEHRGLMAAALQNPLADTPNARVTRYNSAAGLRDRLETAPGVFVQRPLVLPPNAGQAGAPLGWEADSDKFRFATLLNTALQQIYRSPVIAGAEIPYNETSRASRASHPFPALTVIRDASRSLWQKVTALEALQREADQLVAAEASRRRRAASAAAAKQAKRNTAAKKRRRRGPGALGTPHVAAVPAEPVPSARRPAVFKVKGAGVLSNLFSS